jgi:DNA-binding response OmpR family regulator
MEKKILFSEDEPVMIKLLQMSLCEKGYKVVGFDGDNFRRKVAEVNPHAIVLEHNTLMVPGAEICRFLKNNIKTQDIPVIIFSSTSSDRESAMNAGADYFVQKKSGIKELERILDEILIADHRD